MRLTCALAAGVAALASVTFPGAAALDAASPHAPAPTSGRVSVRFQLSGGGHGSATWTDAYHLIKKPDQFSGCAIVTVPALHDRKLLVQIYPSSLDAFLTRRFKVTVELTKSGAPNPLGSVAVLGYNNTLYENINAKPHITLKDGGRSGAFTVSGATDSSTQHSNITLRASWSCSTLWHFTDNL